MELMAEGKNPAMVLRERFFGCGKNSKRRSDFFS